MAEVVKDKGTLGEDVCYKGPVCKDLVRTRSSGVGEKYRLLAIDGLSLLVYAIPQA